MLAEGYLVRKRRELHATPKAQALKKVLGKLQLDVLTNPEMTGKWEARLAEIEAGTGETRVFMADIRRLAEDLVAKTVSSPADLMLEELPDIRMPGTNQPFVKLLQHYATADGSVRIPKFAYGRYLLPSELRRLLADGRTDVLEGFRGRNGRSFKACIVATAAGRPEFEFPQRRVKFL
jgi:DNA topoisomerase III